MTKVEELRDAICKRIVLENDPNGHKGRQLCIDVWNVVADSHAEGAEEERERIKDASELITEGSAAVNSNQFSQDADERLGITDVFARHDLFIIPASVLAPPKGA